MFLLCALHYTSENPFEAHPTYMTIVLSDPAFHDVVPAGRARNEVTLEGLHNIKVQAGLLLRNLTEGSIIIWVYGKTEGFLIIVTYFKFLSSNPAGGSCCVPNGVRGVMI